MDAALKLDELMLEVGYGLVPLVDAKQGGQLLSKIKALRKHLARQLGFLVPPIHITDNLTLREDEYVIYLRGMEIARWRMRRDSLLAISSQFDRASVAGHGNARAGVPGAGQVDCAGPEGAGPLRRLHGGGCHHRAWLRTWEK